MAIDTTDESFEKDVLERSTEIPVVVDLWAPWCGPCKTLGPIIEKVVDATEGAVELVKVNIDDNPNIARAFNVQSIPAVFALKDRQVVNSFIGALPEHSVAEFIASLAPAPSEADLLAEKGDEASLRSALAIDPGHENAITALARMLVDRNADDEALELIGRIPETPATRQIAATARLHLREQAEPENGDLSIEQRLEALLDHVKGDTEARQEYLDIIESLDEQDPRKGQFRRALSSRLF